MSKFTNGSTKISLLVPSRERVGLLEESIRNKKPDTEVLVWVDEDDPQLEDYKKIEGIQLFVMPPIGYTDFHNMINFLADRSRGEWLILWNDDALFLTDNWEDKIPEPTDSPEVLNFFDPLSSANNLFPAVNRAMYNAMGHYSLSAHCDSWVQDIANELGIHIPVFGIDAVHRRDSMVDATKQKTQAAYAHTSPLHYSTVMQELMIMDIKKIQKVLGEE